MRIHTLKCWPEFFAAILDGTKKLEIRKDDRGFQLHDLLALHEYQIEADKYTGRVCLVAVTHIVYGNDWLKEGHVAMSIRPLLCSEKAAAFNRIFSDAGREP